MYLRNLTIRLKNEVKDEHRNASSQEPVVTAERLTHGKLPERYAGSYMIKGVYVESSRCDIYGSFDICDNCYMLYFGLLKIVFFFL